MNLKIISHIHNISKGKHPKVSTLLWKLKQKLKTKALITGKERKEKEREEEQRNPNSFSS